MVDPYSLQALIILDTGKLRELADLATQALRFHHMDKSKPSLQNELVDQHPTPDNKLAGSKRARVDDETNSNPQCEDAGRLDELNKDMEIRASEMAGDYVLSFGKHTGIPIRRVDLSYLVWAMGFSSKRQGAKYMRLTHGSHTWIRENQPMAYDEIRKYMMWRCWACRSSGTRYRTACLCHSCYIDSL